MLVPAVTPFFSAFWQWRKQGLEIEPSRHEEVSTNLGMISFSHPKEDSTSSIAMEIMVIDCNVSAHIDYWSYMSVT